MTSVYIYIKILISTFPFQYENKLQVLFTQVRVQPERVQKLSKDQQSTERRPAQGHCLTANQVTEGEEGHGEAQYTPGELNSSFGQNGVLLENTT